MARTRAFTLIELVVVMAIVALLVALAAPRYFKSVDRSKEAVLRSNLATVRDALDKFYGDTGKYPEALADLVEKKYLRTLPKDPITDSATTWLIVPPDQPEKGGVFDLHSGAEGNTTDGVPYGEL
ncbi:MAG: prepilin-type N-terminal cleavage/methylation domain-containing protein [Rhodocyclaceae bacterium]